MSLRDSAGGVIRLDDGTGVGANAQITYTATYSGTYFIGAGSYSLTATGSYRVYAEDTTPVPNVAPLLSVPSSISKTTNQSFTFNSLISASDSDGSVVSYTFYDTTPGAGYLTYNGARISGTSVSVSAADLSRVGYFTGATAGSNQIAMEAFDDDGAASPTRITTINIAAPTDTLAPSLSSFTPTDNSIGVAIGSNIVLNFNEAVKAGTGNIIIYNSNGTVFRSIAATDTTQVTFSGSTATINPAVNLAAGAGYYVQMASGVVKDSAGNSFAGISNTTAFNFTTASAVTTDNAGNDLATATSRAVVATTTGSVGVGADSNDFFKFVATTNGRVTANLTGLTADIDLRALNSTGGAIISSTLSGTSNETLGFNIVAGQTYYLHVDPYNVVSSNYTLATSFVPTVTDTLAPSLSSFTPTDNSIGVAIGSNIVLNFNEAVKAGTGNIVIFNANGTVFRSIAATDTTQVTFSGSTATINPAVNLVAGAGYYVQMASGVVKDNAGNSFAGITNTTAFNFTTASAVTTDNAGNSLATATLMTLGATKAGSVGIGLDTNDYFKFVATANGQVSARLTGLASDIDLRALSSTGAQLAVGQLDGTASESIVFNVLAGQTYHIHVDPFNLVSSNYTLATSFVPLLTRPAALQQLPLLGTPIVTQGYGGDTSHGYPSDLGSARIQYAIDFAVPVTRAAVMSVAGGVVVAVRNNSTGNGDGSDGGLGNFVTILHDGGFYATYAHLSSTSIALGAVTAGTTIGFSGNTGTSGAEHLHLHFGTKPLVDPTSGLIRADGSADTVPPAFFASFFSNINETAGYDVSNRLATDVFGTGGNPTPDRDADELFGTAVANRIFASSGNDRLNGLGGNDILVGGTGNDKLNGGAGADTLVGGLGKDTFDFNLITDSGVTASTRDTVVGFVGGEVDTIDLSTILGTFVFTTAASFAADAINQVRFQRVDTDSVVGNDSTLILIDNNSDIYAESTILLKNYTVPLVATDFIL